MKTTKKSHTVHIKIPNKPRQSWKIHASGVDTRVIKKRFGPATARPGLR